MAKDKKVFKNDMKVSKAQHSVLEKLNEENVKLSVTEDFIPSAWIYRDTPHLYMTIRIATLRILQKENLIEKIGERSGMIDYYAISTKGNQALKGK